MKAYIIRRILYMVPILLGVNILTFLLFFMVNTPDEIAKVHLGEKYVTQEAIEDWKISRGYDKPLFINPTADGLDKITDTIFVQKSLKLFIFDFGVSDAGSDISHEVFQRMWPSLALAIPALILGLTVNISFALMVVFFRGSYLDKTAVAICVGLMSVSSLFYLIGGQYIFANEWRLVPVSGYDDGFDMWRFLLLPVFIGIIGGVGSGTRWYRTIFIEQINQDYVRTARAKGLSNTRILFVHVLRNGLIPILTGVVVLLPLLFLGSLLTESFFGIPGLGSYTINAIQQQDFAIVRSMVFLGAFLYVIGLMLTDLSYAWADPRIRLS